MQLTAYIKYLKTSPKKLRLAAAPIRKMSVQRALDTLFYTPDRAAKILYKSIKSAADNAAAVSKQDLSVLQFNLLAIEEGSRLKRFKSGGRGTAKPYKRRSAHIKIILETK